jgi:hypothetical protein
MALEIAQATTQKWYDGQRVHVVTTITPSGNYATGGDTLSLALAEIPARTPPIFASIVGKAGFVYQYVKGTGPNDGKVMVRVNTAGGANEPLGEHTAAAYAAGVLADVIIAHFIFEAWR